MLSLVEKLKDLKVGLNNDKYIDVILQSLPLSYDSFIVNVNMNGLENSINELINILVQYKDMSKKSTPSPLVGEASTSKAKEWARERGRWVLSSSRGQMISAPIAVRKDIGRGIVLHSSQARSNWIITAQDKRKLDSLENTQILHARLGHISQDRMKRLVDSKSLEIDNLDKLPVCESCLKGEMTRKPFIVQSTLANGLLDLICTNVCGPLNTQAREAFSYFITFIDDHLRYGYVYLMRYKSEVFVRFKEFKLEENGLVSQWTLPGTPQLNGMAERRNRNLLDMIRSMMSFMELPLSFWGYALEMAAKLLNIAPCKTVAQTLYQIWHGKLAFYKYLRVWVALHRSRSKMERSWIRGLVCVGSLVI
ncbi:UNVERIFIED_CONTAM: hypothetical protein Sradi_5828200 [Sesamum radiatum]|uniref:GAG-pre-integrase domain-containing protein n=1 Tax=Sesamum radiatum TaxID=300843 RepID=A0AAW2KRD2_SESRA